MRNVLWQGYSRKSHFDTSVAYISLQQMLYRKLGKGKKSLNTVIVNVACFDYSQSVTSTRNNKT